MIGVCKKKRLIFFGLDLAGVRSGLGLKALGYFVCIDWLLLLLFFAPFFCGFVGGVFLRLGRGGDVVMECGFYAYTEGGCHGGNG